MNKLKKLFDILEIKPNNIEIYYEALTHKTFTNENRKSKSYEKLEFLGDSILQFYSSLYIFKLFHHVNEGIMSNIRAKNVSTTALAFIVKQNKINKFIICSNNIDELQNNDKICSDVFESLIAAIYLDLGVDKLEKFLEKFLYPLIKSTSINEEELKDPKTRLQELLQPTFKKPIHYDIKQFNNIWIAKVICGSNIYGTGKGKTKSEAEVNSAINALQKLKM